MIRVREALQKFYTENDYWVLPVIKAITAFLCFFLIYGQLDHKADLFNIQHLTYPQY